MVICNDFFSCYQTTDRQESLRSLLDLSRPPQRLFVALKKNIPVAAPAYKIARLWYNQGSFTETGDFNPSLKFAREFFLSYSITNILLVRHLFFVNQSSFRSGNDIMTIIVVYDKITSSNDFPDST